MSVTRRVETRHVSLISFVEEKIRSPWFIYTMARLPGNNENVRATMLAQGDASGLQVESLKNGRRKGCGGA